MKVLQRNCAAYLKLRNWQWWRLFTKVGSGWGLACHGPLRALLASAVARGQAGPTQASVRASGAWEWREPAM